MRRRENKGKGERRREKEEENGTRREKEVKEGMWEKGAPPSLSRTDSNFIIILSCANSC